MEISAIKMAVRDAINRGQISRLEAEQALHRIESAEAEQTRTENNVSATEEQKKHALLKFNRASEEAADLLNRV